MSRHNKKPGLLYRIFFKDPYRDLDDLPEGEWQPNPMDEWPEVDMPSPPYLGAERPFGAAPTVKRWVKLQLSSPEINAEMELHDFPIEIGSAPCSIQLQGKGISPRHAIMDLHNGVLTVTDTHSKNGVSIGSTWLNPGVGYPVNPGDVVLIGRTKITVLDYPRHYQPPPAKKDTYVPEDIMSPEEILEALDEELAGLMVPPQEEEEEQEWGEEIIEYIPPQEEEIPEEEPPEEIPIPEPEPPPTLEPINKKTTLVKLMDEPDASLFFHVLDIKDPTQQEEEPQPEEGPAVEEIEEIEVEPEKDAEEEVEEAIVEETLDEEIIEIIEEPEPEEVEPEVEIQEGIPEEIPEIDLSAEEFIEALIEKSSARPTPSWKSKEPPSKATKTCTKCNTANNKKDKFCGGCGTPLNIPTPAIRPFCGECGAKNENMTKFCGECGHKLI
ncbi:MAG: zinc ribbon domain-containing protein [Defluviitaleaceae bacterium]|nr:zinc ribbon domain-containing protein [Defluviitaleaceae bacterium]